MSTRTISASQCLDVQQVMLSSPDPPAHSSPVTNWKQVSSASVGLFKLSDGSTAIPVDFRHGSAVEQFVAFHILSHTIRMQRRYTFHGSRNRKAIPGNSNGAADAVEDNETAASVHEHSTGRGSSLIDALGV